MFIQFLLVYSLEIERNMNSALAVKGKQQADNNSNNNNTVSASIRVTSSSLGCHFLALASSHCRCYKTANQESKKENKI